MTKLSTIITGVAVIILVSGFSFYFYNYISKNSSQPNPEPTQETPIACTMDAMQCPDGTYVGRTPPNCQFVCPN